ARAWRRLGRPAPSPACGGRPGWGRCRTRGFAAQRSDFAPTPTLHRGRGEGGHGRGGGWAAPPCPPHGGEGREGGGVGREAWRRSGRTLPPPQPSPADGGGGHGRGGGWAALLLHPHAGEGRDGGPRPTRGSATKQQHLAASAFHLATTPAVRC